MAEPCTDRSGDDKPTGVRFRTADEGGPRIRIVRGEGCSAEIVTVERRQHLPYRIDRARLVVRAPPEEEVIMTADAPTAALVAERYGVPAWLIERSATARAQASHTTVDAVYATWAGATAAAPTPETTTAPAATPATEATPETPATPEAAPEPAETTGLTGAGLLAAVAEARGLPESMIERSAKARAGAAGVDLDAVLHEWAEDEGLIAPSPSPAATPPKASDGTSEPEPAATPAAPTAPPAPAAAAVGLSGAALLTAVAEARGMPESLTERSAQARAKKEGVTVDDVLNEWAQEAGLTTTPTEPAAAEAAPAPAHAPVAAPAAPSATEAEPATAVGTAVETPPETDTEPGTAPERTRTWPGAFTVGTIAALVLLLTIVALAVFVEVPDVLTEAPVYILGLEPFLTYLDPFIALVIIPGVVLASLVVLAFVALHPGTKPSLRRLAVVVLGYLVLTIVALTIVGALRS